MAQAAFFVNELKIVDKGKYLILMGQRKCVHGQVSDQVFVTVPAELKHLFCFSETTADSAEVAPSDEKPAAAAHRLRQYFGDN